MYKNQLQELAQRSCFNLPSYACVREGPDHAPRFKASVNFNGEIFEGPSHCTTLRQAEHAAAEVALTNLSSRAPSRSLAARVLVSLSSALRLNTFFTQYPIPSCDLSLCLCAKDETGVYKNLLQETTHRAGLKLPVYTTVRSGPGHQPVFTSTVELGGMCIAGDPAKTKKQAEKNAAMAAWSTLKQMHDLESLARSRDAKEGGGSGGGDEQEQVVRYLHNLKPKEENKQSRQREHCQQQQQNQNKRSVGFYDGTSPAASPHRSLKFQKQWRSLEPSADLPSIHPSQQQQKNCSFLAPAHAAGPKVMSPMLFSKNSTFSSQELYSSVGTISSAIYHPTSRPIPSIVRNSSSVPRSQETQTLSDGKKAERLHEKVIQGKSSPSAVSHRSADPNSSVFAARTFCPSTCLNIPIKAAPLRNSSTIPLPRMMTTVGFHARCIAPPVQIRSVIPVCAAPPMRQPQPPPATNGLPVSVPEKETEDGISAATAKLNNLQL